MKKRTKLIFFLIYLIFGVYLINFSLEFIALPEFISNLNNWIILIGGVLIILGGINHFRLWK